MDCKGLHFGPFEINLEVHELRKHGLRIRLPEQPFHALVLLLERHGDVVTREELRRALWPDQNWGDLDHRLNKAINRIREALGDSADTPRFLETLPRIGYRFLVPVEPLPVEHRPKAVESPGPPPELPAPAAQPRVELPPSPVVKDRAARTLLWPMLAGLALVGALGLAVPTAFHVFAKKPAAFLPIAGATPLTTYLGSELYPCFSPDGTQVVFSWDSEEQASFHLFVTTVNPGAPRQLTSGPQNDLGPVWSPDGRSIAFLREIGAGKAEVRVVKPDGSGGRRVAEIVTARTDHPLAWTRDSRWLVAAANPAGDGPPALFLLSAETGERRRLTSPPVQSGGDLSPAISPDGSKLAFTRSTSTAWRDIFVIPISQDLAPTQEPRRVTDLHQVVDTLAWNPDGRTLYFASAATLAGARFLLRVDASAATPNSGLVETGVEGSGPAISPTTGQLAYSRKNIEQTSIWQLRVPAEGAGIPAGSRLTSSTRRDFTADLSPDGKRLVFSSVRSGPTEVWMSNVDGSGLKRITSLGATPRWSPDGRRIAFESTSDGQSEIYAIDVDTAALTRLTSEPGADIYPSWSRDGEYVYFSSDRSGKPQIWKVPSHGGNAVQITHRGGLYAVETIDGKSIYYTTPQQMASIRSVPANGGEEVEVLEGVVGLSAIAMAPGGLYFLSSLTSTGAKLDLFQFAGRGIRRIASIDHPVHHVLSSPPDGRSVLYTQIDRQDSDLMLLKLK